jgi:putative endonuclease
MSNLDQGRLGEDEAVEYLAKKGYSIVTRNYRFGRGEIDIIAQDGEILVFVEVKARRSSSYGEPEDAVTGPKQKQIRKTAEGYLFEYSIEGVPCRFDVVAIDYSTPDEVLRHYIDAF